MASSFVVHERPIRGPATHAIVIGVGAYHHLPGGKGRQVRWPEGMRQLTSPPTSARRFAEWLISSLNYPPKPLASVSLLLSEADPEPFVNRRTGAQVRVETATVDAIEGALLEWRERGDRRPEQRLIFYFCGHGIARGTDTVLLAADYGAKPLNPLDGAIDFRRFRQAMAVAKVAEQVYFVDACRVGSENLLNADGYSGRPIFQPDLRETQPQNLMQPVFYASIPGDGAYGLPATASVFTGALINGLHGSGAISEPEGWKVTGTKLQETINFQVEPVLRELGRGGTPVVDFSTSIDLNYPTETPKGTAILYCDSPDATAAATFSYAIGGNVHPIPVRNPDRSIVELPAAEYEFSAQFPPGSWTAEPQRITIEPVSKKVRLVAVR